MKEFDFDKIPIVEIANEILLDGVRKGASDIHFDPGKEDLKIREDGTSKIENILKTIGVEYEFENKTLCKPYDTDFYLPEYNIGFEVNGIHWHSNIKNYIRHIQKMHIASKNNGCVFFLWEDDIIKNRDKITEYIINAIKTKNPDYIHPEDNDHDCFYVNKNTFERTYNIDDIQTDIRHWELCYVIKKIQDNKKKDLNFEVLF